MERTKNHHTVAVAVYPPAVLLLALAVGLAQPAPAQEALELRAVEIEARGSDTAVRLTLAGEPSYTILYLADPPRFVIDLPGAMCALEPRQRQGPGTLLRSVRVGQYRSPPRPVCRVVCDLEPAAGRPRVERSDGGLSVFIPVAEEVPAMVGVTAEPPTAEPPTAESPTAESPAPSQRGPERGAPGTATPVAPEEAISPTLSSQESARPLMPLVEQLQPAHRLVGLELRTVPGGGVEVVVVADGHLEHRLSTVDESPDLLLELPGVAPGRPPSTLPVEGSVLRRVHLLAGTPTRLRFELAQPTEAEVRREGSRLVLRFPTGENR